MSQFERKNRIAEAVEPSVQPSQQENMVSRPPAPTYPVAAVVIAVKLALVVPIAIWTAFAR
jgi:hypothetical protein